MNRKERNTQTFATKTKKTNRKSGLYIVRKCAENIPQMAKWDIPNGKMGHPKWQNGTAQMVVWGMRKEGSGHRNKGAEVEFWGVEGREMGFIGLVTRPKLGETGEKDNPFCNFLSMENGIIIR